MKKLFYLAAAFIAVLFLFIILIIPGEVTESKRITARVPDAVILNHLVMKKGWLKWWPNKNGINSKDSSTFTYKGITFRIDNNTFTKVNLTVTDGNVRLPSVIHITPRADGAAQITWSFTYPTSNNPIKRFLRFERSRELASYTGELLGKFRDFVEDVENVYGLHIQYAKVQDSLVVTTKTISQEYPDTREIYHMIGELRNYTRKHQIDKGGLPMLNVTQSAKKEYHIMVALPVLRRAPATDGIAFKQMVLGNILVAEVRGGSNTVNQALSQLNHFIQDNEHTSPAIPFQVLLTDRTAEPDSSKWITRLYFPIL